MGVSQCRDGMEVKAGVGTRRGQVLEEGDGRGGGGQLYQPRTRNLN